MNNLGLTNSEIKLILKNTEKIESLKNEFDKIGTVNIIQNQTVVSIIGNNIFQNQKMFSSLLNSLFYENFDKKNIIISNSNIRIIIDDNNLENFIKYLHSQIFE